MPKFNYLIVLNVGGEKHVVQSPFAAEADRFGRAMGKQICQRPEGAGVDGVMVYDPNREAERYRKGVGVDL